MSNGRKVELYTYRFVDEVRIATPAGEFDTLHFERVTSGRTTATSRSGSPRSAQLPGARGLRRPARPARGAGARGP
jgi:hypothetical protein